jgi:hypothetical protein
VFVLCAGLIIFHRARWLALSRSCKTALHPAPCAASKFIFCAAWCISLSGSANVFLKVAHIMLLSRNARKNLYMCGIEKRFLFTAADLEKRWLIGYKCFEDVAAAGALFLISLKVCWAGDAFSYVNTTRIKREPGVGFEDDTHPKLWERNSNKKFVRSALCRCRYYIKYAYFRSVPGAPICSKIVPGEEKGHCNIIIFVPRALQLLFFIARVIWHNSCNVRRKTMM